MKFTHYLITRFNVPYQTWNLDKTGQPTLDATWMEHRLMLFRRYCVPTVAGQSEKNFIWLIYMDAKTSPELTEEIRKLVEGIPQASIRFVLNFSQLLSDIQNLFQAVKSPYIISSRLDNDDGLGTDYIRLVQNTFIENGNTIINLDGGILYDEENKILTEIRRGKLNHYGSLIEEINPESKILSIMGFPHDAPPKGYNVINADHRFSWLKIIHSRNVSSRARGWPISLSKVLENYKVAETDFKVSLLNVIRYLGYKLIRKLHPGVFKNSK